MTADSPASNPLTRLRRQMAETLSLDDVRTLSQDLAVNFDDLPGDGPTPKLYALIVHLHKNGRLADLHAWLERTHSSQSWPALNALETASLPEDTDLPSGDTAAIDDDDTNAPNQTADENDGAATTNIKQAGAALSTLLKRTFGWNWRRSPSHMLLLLTFLDARVPDQYPPALLSVGITDWEEALGEPAAKAVERMLIHGALKPLPATERLEAALRSRTNAELRTLLKEHGQPSGGNKDDLVSRLVREVGPIPLASLLPAAVPVRCTTYGRQLGEEWLRRKETPAHLRKLGPIAKGVLVWLLLEAIAPEVIGSFVYDLLTQVDKEALRELKIRPPATGRDHTTRITLGLSIDWVYIPAGRFWMGSGDDEEPAYSDEKPRHRLYLPDYHISKYPITNQQYAVFVNATGHRQPRHWENGRIPRGKDNHPFVSVSWQEAVAFCQWTARRSGLDIRLPTEAEWEKAARGPKGYRYPWGNRWDSSRCNSREAEIGTTTPVTRYAGGVSPYGVWDMVGNVWEWTSTIYKPYPYRADDDREDMSDKAAWRVLRGGSFAYRRSARAASRLVNYRVFRFFGFRVVGVRLSPSHPDH